MARPVAAAGASTGEPRVSLALAAVGWLTGFFASNATFVLTCSATVDERTEGSSCFDDLSLTALALLNVPLWLGLGGAVLWAHRERLAGLRPRLGDPGRLAAGVAIGIGTQLVLVPALYVPIFWLIGRRDVSEAARRLTDKADGDVVGVVVLSLMVLVAAPFVEELFFRGLLFSALRARMAPAAALGVQAVLFGAAHLQPLQLPALVLFGAVAGVLVHRWGRLGPAIAAHVGFNSVTVLSLLA